jgi:hypothetical protein
MKKKAALDYEPLSRTKNMKLLCSPIIFNKKIKARKKIMSKELTVVDFQTQLAEMDKIQDTCKKLLSTKHYMALGEAGIHAIMSRAKALGIHPFEALNGGFHCINGKVGMSTEMMSALVRKRGHSVMKDPKSNNEICILHGTRADNGDKMTVKFDKEDALAAGLWGSTTWKKYPGVMLYNRAMSMLFRQLFSDLSLGAGYVEDELKEITRTGEYKNSIDIQVEEIKLEMPQVEAKNEKKQDKIEISGEKISQEQFLFLKNAIGKDVDFEDRLVKYLKTMGIEGLQNLPIEYFDRYLKWAQTNAKEKAQEVENAVA